MRRLIPVLLYLTALDQNQVAAQETTGAVVGRVVAKDRTSLTDVEIVASGPRLLGERRTATQPGGHFTLQALPAGTYSVTVRLLGFRPLRFEDLPVRLGKTTSLGDIRLEPQAVELPELVVSGERALLDPTSASGGLTLPAASFETLPTDRSYISIATLAPQTNMSYIGDGPNIAGATGLENVYFIDGANVTDPYLGNKATNLPYNFVQEIQVSTSGFDAEYGRALGGIVNVVTPSGGNEWHGQAFGFGTGSGLAGAPRRGLLEADVSGGTDFDLGLSAGGPLVRDRAWFFGAYSRARLSEDAIVPGFGAQESFRKSDLFAGKLTWRPRAQTTLVFSVFGDPTRHQAIGPFTTALGTPVSLGNIDPFLGDVRSGGTSVSLQARHQIGARLLLDASLSRLDRHDGDRGATELGRTQPLYMDLSTGHWSGGFGHFRDFRSRRTAAKLAGTGLLGLHTVKLGAEYEDNRLDQVWEVTGPGITSIVFVPIPPETVWGAIYLHNSDRVRNRVLSVYAQDSWLAAWWLRLNLGLRWDGQYVVGADGRTAQLLADQIQPRIGAVAHWGGDSRNGAPGSPTDAVSASFARYYEQLPTGFAIRKYSTVRNGFYFYDQDPALNPAPTDSLDFSGPITPEVPDLRGQYVDEWTLGYRRVLARALTFGTRFVYRDLGEAITSGHPGPGQPGGGVGNPGRGNLSFLPPFVRRYTALEFSLGGRLSRWLELHTAYVWSRTRGNYPGLYDSDIEGENPNSPQGSGFPEQIPNSTGPLPNDRRHVGKLFGSAQVTPDVALGIFATLQSGTPLNEFGAMAGLPASDVFLRPRGSVGRTPTLWDLNFRGTYVLPLRPGGVVPRLILDVFHIGSPRRAVSFDQVRFQDVDQNGNQILPNPNYLKPTRFQPPMSVRLGLIADF